MRYRILKDFKGSPDGRYAVQYRAGEDAELTDSLAEVALAEGWAAPIKEAPPAPAEKKKTGKGGAKASAGSSVSDE